MTSRRKPQRIVLLGTGTDVGKTYVGSRLAAAWREKKGPVLGLKPIESGVSPEVEGLQGDAASLKQGATEGRPPLYAFADPISPHLAARRVNQEIALSEVSRWVEEQERVFSARQGEGKRLLSIVETAGGVFSPTSDSTTNADLARILEPAIWLLVAPDSLGVLHDVQATIRALTGRVPDLVALSRARDSDTSTGLNAAEIKRVVYDQLGEFAPRGRRVPVVKRDGSAMDLLAAIEELLQ